jgi:transcriptional regulator with XRE-family HTH domain
MVLYQARKEAKMTQEELAKRTGTTKSYLLNPSDNCY